MVLAVPTSLETGGGDKLQSRVLGRIRILQLMAITKSQLMKLPKSLLIEKYIRGNHN